MKLKQKKAIVTGGSRGLGKGIVKSLRAEGAEVWAVARTEADLAKLREEMPDVRTIACDVTDEKAPATVFAQVQPDILVLCAGALPHLAPIQEQSWDSFQKNWLVDTKSSFHFGQAVLKTPLAAGSQIITISSGAALGGSPVSGGYSGAKRMQWLLSNYFQKESDRLELDLRFLTVLPQQQFRETELGNAASSTYAAQLGISQEKFLERFGTLLTPDGFGDSVVSLLHDARYADISTFGINGTGIRSLD